MAGRKTQQKGGVERAARFSDDEERELIESFEAALDRGDLQPSAPQEQARVQAEWRAIAQASLGREMVSLSLPIDDLRKIRELAREQGVSDETLMGRVLQAFAQSAKADAL